MLMLIHGPKIVNNIFLFLCYWYAIDMRKPEDEIPPIDRYSPEVQYKLGKQLMRLTYENAVLYEFDEPYAALCHVTIDHGKEQIYVFGEQQLYEELYDIGFPCVILPYPSAEDIHEYIKWEAANFEVDVAKLLPRK